MFVRPMSSTVEVRKDDILVRCREVGKDSTYEGPSIRVWADKDWAWVSTDDYESTAMFNIEALPALRRALAKLSKQIKSQQPSK
jgi:hypothetical protein